MTRSFNLADLFEVVAQAVPERMAFVCGPQSLRYRDLDLRATRLASALHAKGLRRGTMWVLPCLTRPSIWKHF